jgi:hypothetical protein
VEDADYGEEANVPFIPDISTSEYEEKKNIFFNELEKDNPKEICKLTIGQHLSEKWHTVRLGPHYRLFIGRQFSWFLISMRTYVSAHTKAIVVGRQIDRKIVGIPIQQESWPTIDRAWCTIRVRTFTDYTVGNPHILGVQWLSAVQKFRFLISYPTSTRRHGNFAGVHTLLRIILSSNSAVLINIITGVSPPHFDFFVFYVLCQC